VLIKTTLLPEEMVTAAGLKADPAMVTVNCSGVAVGVGVGGGAGIVTGCLSQAICDKKRMNAVEKVIAIAKRFKCFS